MQVIHWIDSMGWTDSPQCVYKRLRQIAIGVNDNLSDEGRQELLKFIPRLMGTNIKDPSGRYTHGVPGWALDAEFSAIQAAWAEECRWSPGQGYSDEQLFTLLTRALDAYDRLTGRKPQREELIDFSALCALA